MNARRIAAWTVCFAMAGVISTTASAERSSQPPKPSYPRSYFAGPLGTRNILPPKLGAFLILQYGGYGIAWAQGQAGILQRERDLGRPFDGIQVHYGGAGTYRGVPNCVAPDRMSQHPPRWIHHHGSLSLVAWSPNRSTGDINQGKSDRCFDLVADTFKRYKFPIMLRLFSEFDLSNTTYHACGSSFIKAWRHVVRIFARRGAINVGFWWVPTEGGDRACAKRSYPGDAYVDWVGSDWYNACDVGEENCYSSPLHSGWAEFSDAFNYPGGTSQHDLWGKHKPFVVGETGTVFDAANPSQKGDWFRNIAMAARAMRFLRGISFYDEDVSAVEGPKANYMVNYPEADPDVYAGFKEMAANPWFNTR